MSRRLAVAGATGLLAAGCGGGEDRAGPGPRPSTSPSPEITAAPQRADTDLLQDVLAVRAGALERGRPGAYARTGTPGRRVADRLAARRARALGLRDVRLVLETADIEGHRARVRARLSYRVRGVRGTFGGAVPLQARRSGSAGWRIAGRLPPRGRAPWEADAFRRVATRHFVIWMPQDLDPGSLPGALEDGYARMRDTLKAGTLRRRYLVVVARNPVAARRVTGRIGGLGTLTALTDTEVRQSGRAKRVVGVASQRLLVVWSNFLPLDFEAQRITVAHELTHAALAPVTSGRTPGWLTEGIALYVSGDRRTAEAAQLLLVAPRRAVSLRALSRPDAFGVLGGDVQRAAYAYASAAAHHIADRYGRAKLLGLYDSYNRASLRGRSGDPALTDAATRRVLGVSLTALERELRAALERAGAF